VTSDIVEHEEEAADDAAVLLPLPAQCREVLGGGSLDGDDLLQRNARIDEVFGQPFRQAHPAEDLLLAKKSLTGEALAARRALLHQVHLHVVRIARQAGLGPCTSYLEFGTALNQKGKNNMVVGALAGCRRVPQPRASVLDHAKGQGRLLKLFPGRHAGSA